MTNWQFIRHFIIVLITCIAANRFGIWGGVYIYFMGILIDGETCGKFS